MKRHPYLLTVLLLLVGLLAGAFPAHAASPSYTITNTTAVSGKTFTVSVGIKDNPGIISLRFTVSYDSRVELVSVTDKKLLSGWTTPSATLSSPYTLRWADSLATTNNTANGTVVTLTFKAKDTQTAVSSSVNITHVEARNASGTKVAFAGKTATISITPPQVLATGVTLNAASASITMGTKKQLTATVSPSNAANKAVIWGSSNTSVATVSSTGLVTAKAVGKATVTCKAADGHGAYAPCAVTVLPKTPTGVKAVSASYNSVKITWTAVSGATGYAVYRAASKTGTYSYLKSTTSTTLTDTKLSTGTTNYYKVKAYTTVGSTKHYSAYSAIVSAKAVPAVPASFTAAKASATSVKTAWKAVTGATGYEVWMATSSTGTYSKLTTTTKTTYTKSKLTKNKTYYFKVRAYKTVNDKKVYGAFTIVKSAKPS